MNKKKIKVDYFKYNIIEDKKKHFVNFNLKSIPILENLNTKYLNDAITLINNKDITVSIQHIIGIIGETLVKNMLHYNENVISIMDHNDWYDSEKDGSFTVTDAVHGELKYTYEVKTQIPWYNKNGFSIKLNQEKKVKGVDFTYFVEIPYGGYLFESKPPNYIDTENIEIGNYIFIYCMNNTKDNSGIKKYNNFNTYNEMSNMSIVIQPKNYYSLDCVYNNKEIFNTLMKLSSKIILTDESFFKNRRKKYDYIMKDIDI